MTDRTDRQCRLSLRAFHQTGVPAMLERRGPRTLIGVDLWADRYDLLGFLHTELHPGELNHPRGVRLAGGDGADRVARGSWADRRA